MAKLNEKTISEFVDSMMPAKEEVNHEFTVNGTVASVDNNGIAVVYLDGGDSSGTPCQTTVGCSAGDRVIVSFKNREPVVTSNITSPTTSVAQLNAEVANINTLMAQKATITQLNTEVANINTVMAQKATITQLNTEVANINNVVAQKATISYVDTKTVNAVNVFATNGTFSGTLRANKGEFGGSITFISQGQQADKLEIGPTVSRPISITYSSGNVASETYISSNGLFTTATASGSASTNWDYVDISGSGIEIANGSVPNRLVINKNEIFTYSGSRLISSSEISTLSNLAGWINRGAFTGNLNSTTISPGFYRLGASDSYSGTKPSPAPTWCLFFQSPAYNTQVIIDGADKFIAFRDHTGNPAAWSAWRKLTAT